jgi:hypothetical protein
MRTNALLFPIILGLACPARAFNQAHYQVAGAALYWNLTNPPADISTNIVNPNTRAIRFFLASDGYSATNKVNELNAIRASFAQWQSIPGTMIKFEEGGLIPPQPDMVNRNDNTNIIYWVKSTDFVDNGTANIVNVLGTAFTLFRSDGTMSASDILLNGRYRSWFTDFSDKANLSYFVEATVLHELGHTLGLDHASIGGATMLAAGQAGIDPQTGLSVDEVAFARATYPRTNVLAGLGQLRGQVTKNGSAVFGAVVVVEDSLGNLLGSTLTRANGSYQMPALPPGSVKVRVCPLDPANAFYFLIRGIDINTDPAFKNVDPTFLPTTNSLTTLTAGGTNVLDFALTSASPAFRITVMRDVTTSSNNYTIVSLPGSLYPGQSNRFMGVFSTDLPTNGATVTITGDGLTIGPLTYSPGDLFPELNGISWPISVASNATPGLRSVIVSKGTDVAYANGFLEIVPNNPDYNFDGLDDVFQREYFPLFTAPEAAPVADPDGDGMTNASEYIAGTAPTNALSVLKIDSASQTASGTTVTWRSVPGKRYQLFSRLNLAAAAWQKVGGPVTAAGATAQLLDASATDSMRFYRVQVLP